LGEKDRPGSRRKIVGETYMIQRSSERGGIQKKEFKRGFSFRKQGVMTKPIKAD